MMTFSAGNLVAFIRWRSFRCAFRSARPGPTAPYANERPFNREFPSIRYVFPPPPPKKKVIVFRCLSLPHSSVRTRGRRRTFSVFFLFFFCCVRPFLPPPRLRNEEKKRNEREREKKKALSVRSSYQSVVVFSSPFLPRASFGE